MGVAMLSALHFNKGFAPMNEPSNVQFLLGQLTASVTTLVTAINELESKVSVLTAHMNETKGGLRVLLLMCGAASTVGGGIVALVQWAFTHLHI